VAGKALVKKGVDLLPNNSRRADEAYTVMLQDMVLEVESAFRAHLAYHEARDTHFAERLIAAMDEREARAPFYRLGTEDAQATTKERMRMLAHALANLYTPDLDAERRSRVSRAILALEPSDARALRSIVDLSPDEITRRLPGAAVESLVAAGCLAVPYSSALGSPLEEQEPVDRYTQVTVVGRDVVAALAAWQPSPTA